MNPPPHEPGTLRASRLAGSEPPLRPTRVWDLPTRAFHWLLAASVLGSLVTGQIGGNAMVWHFRLGYVAFGLLLFRLAWGLVGGHWSRFASFVFAPGTVLRYLRGQTKPGEHLEVGHNPLGAFSVFAVLGLLAVQVATGLVADDEIANVGPLNKFVATATGLAATSWHKHWGQRLLMALVVLHVAAIVFYLVKKKINLIRPMLGGDKLLPADVLASADSASTRALALVLAALSAAAVTWVVSLGA
jgi:cytochrome b